VYKYRIGVILAVFVVTLFPAAHSQDLNSLIEQFGVKDLASQYLRPAADAVGYSFNSGLYHTAEVKQGLHVWVGARGVWTFVPSEQRSFTANLPSELTQFGYPEKVTTATVFGGKGAAITSTQGYGDYVFPDGIDQSSTYIIVPHIKVGSFLGFEVMFRGIPPVTFDDNVGKVSFFGAGLKFSPTSFIEDENNKFNIAVMGAVQQFKAGEYITVFNYNVNVHGSVDMEILTVFSGLGYEGYNIDANYTYTPDATTGNQLPGSLAETQSIGLEFFRRNLRYTVGVNFTLIPLVDLTADYSFGVQDNFSFGAGITF
jgi:hypothetical protein